MPEQKVCPFFSGFLEFQHVLGLVPGLRAGQLGIKIGPYASVDRKSQVCKKPVDRNRIEADTELEFKK